MNYFLHYSGKLPPYYKISINNILSVDKEARIYICSDEKVDFKNISHCYPNELNNQFIEKVRNINYFSKRKNPLWETSLLRIYYLFAMSEVFQIKNFVHFDLDVMIYKPFKEIKNNFDKNKFNITPMTELDLIFGYSYVGSLETYYKICSDTLEILDDIKYFEDRFYNSKKINEMMILNFSMMKNPDNFHLLNTLPKYGLKNQIIFDPAQYGHYLSGVDKKFFMRSTVEEKQFIGREVLEKGFKIKFKNNIPKLIYKDEQFELVNLHIHKKNLNKFKSKNYKCFIN